jgi:predicted DNA-binding transcriptional regulator AlpA
MVETSCISAPDTARLEFKPEVLDRTGLTYPTIWKKMRAGAFPRSRDLGGKVAWVKTEIDAWIAALPVKRLKGDAEHTEMSRVAQTKRHRTVPHE